jgi:hypothetical protein
MAGILLAALALLVAVVTTAQQRAPIFRSLFEGLGSPLPPITVALFASYRWWWVAPLVLVVVALDVIRRPTPPPGYFGITVAAIAIIAVVLHTWMYEAFFQPVIGILKDIG